MSKRRENATEEPAYTEPAADPRTADQPMIPAPLPAAPAFVPAAAETNATWFSWPVGVSEGPLLNAQVRLSPDGKLNDMVGERIVVNRVMSYREDIPDEATGEVKRLTAVILLSPDGKSYKCHSNGIAGAVRELLLALPSSPWVPPLILEVQRRKTRGPNQCLWLKLVGLAESQKGQV